MYGAPTWEVQGIDISKWNGSMNFAVTKTKCQYVYIRAGYGNGWEDGSLDTFYIGARAQDIPVGLYWYCRIGEDPIAHADGFAEVITAHPPQLRIVLDAESSTLGPQATLEWLKTVDGRIRSKTNRVPKVYTSMGFWNTGVARSSYWAGRELWDANWTTRDTPIIPFDWVTWDDWQWSADGNRRAAEYGSTGGDADMDLNRFNGTVVQFNTKYGTHILPLGGVAPPQPPGAVPPYVIITIGELAIHSTPAPLQNNIIGHALLNSRWYPLKAVDGGGVTWYEVAQGAYISKNYTRYP
jgi:GH25 family lysozyme M1 (1,4-beta-N-acetylmuramidase)